MPPKHKRQKTALPFIFQSNDDKHHAESFFNELNGAYPIKRPIKIISVNHVLPSTLYFLNALEQIGTLAAIIPKSSYKNPEVLAWLTTEHADIFKPGINKAYLDKEDYAVRFLKQAIGESETGIIVDIGGYFACALERINQDPDLKTRLLGIVEDTENGHQKYMTALAKCKNNHFPIYSSARITLKAMEDYNIGKSIVHAADTLLRTQANTILERSRSIVVLGFGKIGEGIAAHLQQKNIQNITIFDHDIRRSGRAAALGYKIVHNINDRNELLKNADVIFCATGNQALKGTDWDLLKDNVYIASCTSKDDELCTEYLEATSQKQTSKDIAKYKMANKEINLLADGDAVNFIYNAVSGPYLYSVQASIIASISEMINHRANQTQNILILDPKYEEQILKLWMKHFESYRNTHELALPFDSQNSFLAQFEKFKIDASAAQVAPNTSVFIEAKDGGKIAIGTTNTAHIINHGNTGTRFDSSTLSTYVPMTSSITATGNSSMVIIGEVNTAAVINNSGALGSTNTTQLQILAGLHKHT